MGGQTAYLTRNVSTTVESTNQGEWRPLIPQDGVYRVEAFIPQHDSITWTCPNKILKRDTSNAHYEIHYDGGEYTKTVDQYPIDDKWVSLGDYPFKAGGDGYVSLSDVTGEPISTTTVSFSSMRWLREMYLPLVSKGVGQVNLTQVWTADLSGNADSVFLPSQAVRFYASGTNTIEGNVSASLQISITGSCGTTTSIYNGTKTIASGNWTFYQDAKLPSSCPGTYLLTESLTYGDNTSTLFASFIVYANTYVLSLPAFDTCTALTPDQMQIWWNQSPYWAMNLYLGGVSAFCPTQVNSTWLKTTSKQGWAFIPTWVGLQAPSGCNSLSHPMSSNPTTARKQGIAEANSAKTKATSLGFDAHTVIYYDMEAFDATSTCKNAVKSFIDGWVAQMHSLGVKAGVYSTSCSAPYWSSLTNKPDQVWVANWYTVDGHYYYDPSATVYGVACLSDSLWNQHQRIRQYTNGHSETWGPLAVRDIDSDIGDGLVAGVPQTLAAARPEGTRNGSAVTSTATSFAVQPPGVSAFQPISDGQGWSQVGNRILWRSEGKNWQDITPPQAAAARLLSTFFLNLTQGWSVLQDNSSGKLIFLSTTDTGASWQSAALPVPADPPVSAAFMGFVDAQDGWLSLQLPSSSNFSLGVLYKTSDGGKSWKSMPLPLAGDIYFLDIKRGWIAGGPAGNELYRTKDGGATWQPQPLVSSADIVNPFFTSLPIFTTDRDGWIAVTVADPLSPHIDIFNTADAGDTWTKRGTISLAADLNPASPSPSVLLDQNHWLLASPGKPSIYTLQPAGLPTQPLVASLPVRGLPAGVIQTQSSSRSTAWALVQNGSCTGDKTKTGEANLNTAPFVCTSSSSLWQTTDSGATWVDITPIITPP